MEKLNNVHVAIMLAQGRVKDSGHMCISLDTVPCKYNEVAGCAKSKEFHMIYGVCTNKEALKNFDVCIDPNLKVSCKYMETE